SAEHESLGRFRLAFEASPIAPVPLFTENESNLERIFQSTNGRPYVKDSFDACIVHGRTDAVNPERIGTKAAAHYRLMLSAGGEAVLRLRLFSDSDARAEPFGSGFDAVFERRAADADAFYAARMPAALSAEEISVARQAYAGLLWSKQLYHFAVKDWLEGDPSQPAPPRERWLGRDHAWTHLYNRDVISMPDKWEYPWYAAWDLAFHM